MTDLARLTRGALQPTRPQIANLRKALRMARGHVEQAHTVASSVPGTAAYRDELAAMAYRLSDLLCEPRRPFLSSDHV